MKSAEQDGSAPSYPEYFGLISVQWAEEMRHPSTIVCGAAGGTAESGDNTLCHYEKTSFRLHTVI